jgi:chaperonin GroEL (HSP60 family)
MCTLFANNDNIIGDLIAEAFSKIGDEGVINIEASQGTKTEIKVIDKGCGGRDVSEYKNVASWHVKTTR